MHRPQLLHNMKLFHLCVQFKMLMREGQRKVWKWTWNFFSLSFLTSHCFQPPGKSSGSCYSTHYSTVHLGHMFAIHAFFSQWIGWIMSCLTEREYLIGTWHLTLLQVDVREFCCLFDLPLMFSDKSCQTWKFRYAQICQVKNLHDGRGPSKVLKSCHLALFISLRLGTPDDELVEDPIFVSIRKIL